MVNLPLSSSFALRPVGERSCPQSGARYALGDRHGQSIRGTLQFTPASDLTVTLRGDYRENRGRTSAGKPGTAIAGVISQIVAGRTGLGLSAARDVIRSDVTGGYRTPR